MVTQYVQSVNEYRDQLYLNKQKVKNFLNNNYLLSGVPKMYVEDPVHKI